MSDSHAIPTRPLGRTGLRVGALGLGTAKIGRNTGMKYPAPFELPSDRRVQELLDIAAAAGMNLLDTAPAYETSEERLGGLLAARDDRERWLISTKAGEEYTAGEGSRFDFTPEAIVRSAERSCRRLGRDALDVLLLHSDGLAEVPGEAGSFRALGSYDALFELRARGLARAVGVSPKTAAGARDAIDAMDVVMLAHNPGDVSLRPEIDVAGDRGVGVMIKKALGSGRVGRAGGSGAGHADRGDPIERTLGMTLALPAVSSVVIGTITPANLRDNIRASSRVLRGLESA